MFEIEKDVPIPQVRVGRRSKKRDAMVETMAQMKPGDSFRVEYRLPSMRNFLRSSGIEGVFRAAQETETHIRVWRIS